MRRRFKDEAQDINLVPIMGLVVVLIPMLLLITVFVQLGVVNVSAPRPSVGNPTQQDDDEDKPLGLTIAVSKNGFMLRASGALLPWQSAEAIMAGEPDPPIATERTGSCGPAMAGDSPDHCPLNGVCPSQCGEGNLCDDGQCLKWDYVTLYNRLMEVKKEHATESIVNLTADSAIPYGTLIAVMDAARNKREQETYDSLAEFENATFRTDVEGALELLFSDVVFAVVQ